MAAATMACCTLTFRLARARDAASRPALTKTVVEAALDSMDEMLVESASAVLASRVEAVPAAAVAAESIWEFMDDMLTARVEATSARIVETVAARATSLASTCAASSWTLTDWRTVRWKTISRAERSSASREVRIAACDREPIEARVSVWSHRKHSIKTQED